MSDYSNGSPWVPDPDYTWGDITAADICWGDADHEPHVAQHPNPCPRCTLVGGA